MLELTPFSLIQVNAVIHAFGVRTRRHFFLSRKVVASLLILIDELKCKTDSHITEFIFQLS